MLNLFLCLGEWRLKINLIPPVSHFGEVRRTLLCCSPEIKLRSQPPTWCPHSTLPAPGLVFSLLQSLLSSYLFCQEYSVASRVKYQIRVVLKFPSDRVRNILKAVSYPWIMRWVSSRNHYKPHSSWLQAEAGNPGFNNFLSQCWLWLRWWLGSAACFCKRWDVCLRGRGSPVNSLQLFIICGLDLNIRLHWHTLLCWAALHCSAGRGGGLCPGQCPSKHVARVSGDCSVPWISKPEACQQERGGKGALDSICRVEELTSFVCSPGPERGGEKKQAHTTHLPAVRFLIHRAFVDVVLLHAMFQAGLLDFGSIWWLFR